MEQSPFSQYVTAAFKWSVTDVRGIIGIVLSIFLTYCLIVSKVKSNKIIIGIIVSILLVNLVALIALIIDPFSRSVLGSGQFFIWVKTAIWLITGIFFLFLGKRKDV